MHAPAALSSGACSSPSQCARRSLLRALRRSRFALWQTAGDGDGSDREAHHRGRTRAAAIAASCGPRSTSVTRRSAGHGRRARVDARRRPPEGHDVHELSPAVPRKRHQAVDRSGQRRGSGFVAVGAAKSARRPGAASSSSPSRQARRRRCAASSSFQWRRGSSRRVPVSRPTTAGHEASRAPTRRASAQLTARSANARPAIRTGAGRS